MSCRSGVCQIQYFTPSFSAAGATKIMPDNWCSRIYIPENHRVETKHFLCRLSDD
jgi:hypothetical protein